MRIAIGIISLIIGCVMSAQSFILYMGSAIFNDQATGQSSAGGLFIAFLYFIGGAFAFKLPKVAMFFLAFAGLLGIITGTSSDFSDLTMWGVIALILAVLSFFAGRKPKQQPPITPAP